MTPRTERIRALLLLLAGMDVIDAFCHAFSSMGTGGFSPRAASIAAYDSPAIDFICSLFMFLSGINFTLYFYLFTGRFSQIRKDTELKVYVSIVLLAGFSVTLIELGGFGSFWTSFRYSFFQVISVITTTGYGTWDYTLWKPASQMLIFALFLIGGCAGSTGGGFKVIRLTVLAKQLHN